MAIYLSGKERQFSLGGPSFDLGLPHPCTCKFHKLACARRSKPTSLAKKQKKGRNRIIPPAKRIT